MRWRACVPEAADPKVPAITGLLHTSAGGNRTSLASHRTSIPSPATNRQTQPELPAKSNTEVDPASCGLWHLATINGQLQGPRISAGRRASGTAACDHRDQSFL